MDDIYKWLNEQHETRLGIVLIGNFLCSFLAAKCANVYELAASVIIFAATFSFAVLWHRWVNKQNQLQDFEG
jgi:uncharacterized membrane protein